jgi:hypothetical protein
VAGTAYSHIVDVTEQPDEAVRMILAGISGASDYSVNAIGTTVILTRSYRPTWATVLAILGLLFFLLGLLFLLVKEKDSVTITVALTSTGNRISPNGSASEELVIRLSGTWTAFTPIS